MSMPPDQVRRILSRLESGRADSLYEVGDLVGEAAAHRIRSQLPGGADLHQQLRRDRGATIGRLSAAAASHCRELLRQVRAARPQAPGGGIPSLDSAAYLERLTHLTVERLLVHPAAPPVRLSPVPDGRLAAAAAGHRVVAVVFDFPLAISHELYPLWTDAYVWGRESAAPLLVLGVHVSWLDETCRIRRAIAYSDAEDAFLEADLPSPVAAAAALLLAQAPDTHRGISSRLMEAGVPHINAYEPAAAAADDKWTCYRVWSRMGVPTPATCLLPAGADAEEVESRAAAFMAAAGTDASGWFVQPRRGTESAGVECIRPGPGAAAAAAAAWRRLRPADDTILRPQAGLLWLADADGSRAFDVRLHVCRHRDGHRAESGYLVTAPDPEDPISAVARGARIERLAHLGGACLHRCGDTAAVSWSPSDWQRLGDVACRAAAALDLDLAGVDLKLDLVDGVAVPTVLDANPRPAGLLHSDLMGTEPPEAGVGPGLWQQLDDLAAATD